MASSATLLKTVETSLAIVDVVQESGGATVSEIAAAMEMPPSTVYGHLHTLEEHGYLVKEDDEYHLGLMFLCKGGHARLRRPIYEPAIEKVDLLAEETQERAQFIVEEHGRGYYLHTAIGDHAVQVNARLGRRKYLHSSASGKAILAYLPRPRVEEIIDEHGMPALTQNTIIDRDELFEELEAVRERGFSFNNEESIDGLRAIGVPVIGDDDTAEGAISVSGPTNRMQGDWFEEEIPNLLLGVSNELELNLKFP